MKRKIRKIEIPAYRKIKGIKMKSKIRKIEMPVYRKTKGIKTIRMQRNIRKSIPGHLIEMKGTSLMLRQVVRIILIPQRNVSEIGETIMIEKSMI